MMPGFMGIRLITLTSREKEMVLRTASVRWDTSLEVRLERVVCSQGNCLVPARTRDKDEEPLPGFWDHC